MSGLKNIIQERGWVLPSYENSLTMDIEERHYDLYKKTIDSPYYCHFCGKEIVIESQNEKSLNATETSLQERSLGAHFKCFNKENR